MKFLLLGALLVHFLSLVSVAEAVVELTSEQFNAGITNGDYDLIVDVVAGDVKQSAGPWTVFNNASPISNFDAGNWTISAADGTRLSSAGTLSINPLDNTQIILSGFEAFSIPEPSTAMLLGMGAMVMILRRRIQR